jgi:tetratricopeptide (TPR) repeat protein
MYISASLRQSLVVMAVAYALATCAYSQSSNAGIDTDPADPGTGGANAIDGKLYYPGGRIYDRRIQVRLKSASGIDQFTFTDTNGAFTFRRLRPGTYYIVLDAGNEFEQVNETVDVMSSGKVRSQAIGQTLTVHINLQPSVKTIIASPRTVSARGSAIPEEAATCYKEAVKLSGAGDRNKAIEQLKKALSIYPEFMLARNELGVQYLRLRQPEKAADSLLAALKIAPDAFAPQLNYGIALVRLKKYDAASVSLKKAVDEDGSSAAAHLYLGQALIGLADYNNARIHLVRAIEIGGDDGIESHRYLAAVYIETGQKAEAARELETYLKLNPKVGDADKINQVIRQLRAGN